MYLHKTPCVLTNYKKVPEIFIFTEKSNLFHNTPPQAGACIFTIIRLDKTSLNCLSVIVICKKTHILTICVCMRQLCAVCNFSLIKWDLTFTCFVRSWYIGFFFWQYIMLMYYPGVESLAHFVYTLKLCPWSSYFCPWSSPI